MGDLSERFKMSYLAKIPQSMKQEYYMEIDTPNWTPTKIYKVEQKEGQGNEEESKQGSTNTPIPTLAPTHNDVPTPPAPSKSSVPAPPTPPAPPGGKGAPPPPPPPSSSKSSNPGKQ